MSVSELALVPAIVLALPLLTVRLGLLALALALVPGLTVALMPEFGLEYVPLQLALLLVPAVALVLAPMPAPVLALALLLAPMLAPAPGQALVQAFALPLVQL
mmetsp:Transcript_92675/g.288453  ORF Transcript_92675/g.288453 Transcript_92675/m.288453 type:complete len:103 (-) Transcript_92675:51-359(-)